MTIHPEAIGTEAVRTTSWTSTDTILYSLGVGAGAANPAAELSLTTENSTDVVQRALPTMASVLAGPMVDLFRAAGDFPLSSLVHAAQVVACERELPVEGSAQITSRLTALVDKGKGTLIEATSTAVSPEDGSTLFISTSTAYVRGEGGWDTDPAPRSARTDLEPTQGPLRVEVRTALNQALLYRLSGDRNPLHSDPRFAQEAGFSKPILHGLCTLGIVARVLINELCDGDAGRARQVGARFTAPVLPGEALEIEAWNTGSDQAAFRVTTASDGRSVLDGGSMAWAGTAPESS